MSAAVAEKLSVPVKLKVPVVLSVGFAGLSVIDVFGAIVSAVFQLWLAGDSSTLPASSIARTWKVCGPATSSASV